MSKHSAGKIIKRAAEPPKDVIRKRAANYPWDDERQAFVLEQSGIGVSAGKIAKRMGEKWPNDQPPSRNSVIGKLMRAKGYRSPGANNQRARPKVLLDERSVPTPVNFEVLPPSNVVQLDVQTKEAARKLGPLAGGGGKATSVTSVERGQCHYPIGDPKLPGFAYCGRAAFVKPCRRIGEDGMTPYCADHRILVYDASATQRRDVELKRIKRSLNRY